MTADQFIQVMRDMYLGSRPMQNDCRATVVKALLSDPTAHHRVHVIGFADSGTALHVLTTGKDDRVVTDAFSGRLDLQKGTYEVRFHGADEILDVLLSVPVSAITGS